ncbi:MAG: hypothetical protein ACRDNK_04230 [Solirubrobacteraceae bacterium]
MLVVGGITMANEIVFQPLATGKASLATDLAAAWRIPIATLVAAAALGGLEQISPRLAVGLAYISLITVLFARLGSAPAPVENLATVLGGKK